MRSCVICGEPLAQGRTCERCGPAAGIIEAPANRLPAADRYRRDPEFHTLVDTLEAFIDRNNLTPTELREAIFLAACRWEAKRVRLTFPPGGDRR